MTNKHGDGVPFFALLPWQQSLAFAAKRGPRFSWCLGLTVLVAACGDSVTAPPLARGPTNPDGVNPDVVVMQRTTDIAAHNGVAAVHRTFRQTLTGQMRIIDNSVSTRSRSQSTAVGAANLPVPPISLPARYEAAMCRELPRWTKTMTVEGAGGEVETTGSGDAPASTLRVIQNGRVVSTVERTWVRTSTSWQLERQVTTSADGRVRDVVTYQHLTKAGRPVLDAAIPRATCAAPINRAQKASPVEASLSYYAPSTSSAAINTPKTGVGCDDGISYSGGDPCFDKRMAVYKADAALVILASAMTYACMVPEPVIVPACVSAGAAYLIGVTVLQFAQLELNNCRSEQARKQGCNCPSGSGYSVGTSGGEVSALLSGSRSTTGVFQAPTAPAAVVPVGCGGGGGGGGAPGVGAATNCSYKEWEISYDGGKTWQYWGTFWTCS